MELMNFRNILITSFMLSVLILAAMFIGDFARRAASGELKFMTGIEISIIFAGILLCIEMAIISFSFRKKKKEKPIDEYLKEARGEVY